MLLAIDTSAGTSVAVVDGDRVLGEASDPGTRGHAERIGTLDPAALPMPNGRQVGAPTDLMVAKPGHGQQRAW